MRNQINSNLKKNHTWNVKIKSCGGIFGDILNLLTRKSVWLSKLSLVRFEDGDEVPKNVYF